MKYRFISLALHDAIDAKDGEQFGVLALDRPDRKNALGPRMAMELDTVFNEIRHSAARAVIIVGA